jgi:hypothetical protein
MRNTSRCTAVGRWLLCVLAAGCCSASPALAECPRGEVEDHVLGQLQRYLPLSQTREHFGFVYRIGGRLGSSVVRGRSCPNARDCGVDTRKAGAGIPRGADVLGEWHTHPRDGSRVLSAEDVRGAHGNRHIRCYAAFYATGDGAVYRWDPGEETVPAAMASRARLQPPAAVAAGAQPNGLSSESTGVENHTGRSAPM